MAKLGEKKILINWKYTRTCNNGISILPLTGYIVWFGGAKLILNSTITFG